MAKWTEKITIQDWQAMQPKEREDLIYTLLGITKEQLAQIVTEFEMETLQPPNTLFVSAVTLAKMPVRVKRIVMGIGRGQRKLQIIPMDAEDGRFVLSLQDPYQWGNLFFS